MCNDTETKYFRWCESMVIKIYYSNIAMRDDLIKEVVAEIASKLHYTEGKQTMSENLQKKIINIEIGLVIMIHIDFRRK